MTTAKKGEKPKYETFTSPLGVAVWPHLNGPDTKFKDGGEYHTKLAFRPDSDPKAQQFLDDLQARFDAYVDEVKAEIGPAKAKKLKLNEPFTAELDDDGNETGRVLVKFKMNATYTKKDKTQGTNKPRFFDSRGNPLTNPPSIGNDSKLRIAYSVAGYNTPQGTGISLYLNAVKIVELVEYSGNAGNAKTFGFDEDEGGFTGDTAEAAGFGADDEVDETAAEGAGDDF